MKSKLLPVLLAIISCGCTGRGPHTFPHWLEVDARFSSVQQERIQSAIDQWREATGGKVQIKIEIAPWLYRISPTNPGDAQGVEIHRLFATDPNPYCNAPPGKNLYDGCAIPMGTWMIVSPNVSGDHFEKAVMHELGHHFGLLHPPPLSKGGPRALMQPDDKDGPPVPCITGADLAQFCSIYKCNKFSHSTCPENDDSKKTTKDSQG